MGLLGLSKVQKIRDILGDFCCCPYPGEWVSPGLSLPWPLDSPTSLPRPGPLASSSLHDMGVAAVNWASRAPDPRGGSGVHLVWPGRGWGISK